MSLEQPLMDAASYAITLAQTGEELFQSGKRWIRIGAVLIALAGLLGGLGLIFHKDKKVETTSPATRVVAQIIGALILAGGLGLAFYMFTMI